MKTLSRSLLAIAIATSTFVAANAFQTLEDEEMSSATGQAQINTQTILDSLFQGEVAVMPEIYELLADEKSRGRPVYSDAIIDEVGVSIGQINYTDTDGLGKGEKIGGSIVIDPGTQEDGITVRGKEWDDVTKQWIPGKSITTQRIWVDENGNMRTYSQSNHKAANGMTGPNTQRVWTGVVQGKEVSIEQNVSALGISAGRVLLRSQGQKKTNTSGANLVSNLSLTQESGDSAAHIVNLRNLQSGVDSNGNETYLYHYDALDPDNKIDLSIAKNLANGASVAIVSDGYSRIANLDVDALDGAVQIRGLKHGSGEKAEGLVRSTMLIYIEDGDFVIQTMDQQVSTTTLVESIGIGGASLGSVVIGDLDQSGRAIRVYSH